jgi:transcriptional regulator with XRE-family HTH domain
LDESTQTGKLLLALKSQLKAKHLSYRDVATQLKISEATVKRYFSGKGVTVDVLQRMADIVGLDLFSLVIVAQDESSIQRGLSGAQMAALKRPGPLRTVYFQLLGGWTPAQIAKEFELQSPSELDSHLQKLEGLGLIRRLSKRGVKVLVKPSLGDRAYGEMSGLAMEEAQKFVRELDIDDDANEWLFEVLRLSDASAQELRKIIRHFQNEVRELNRRDLALQPDETQWYRLFVGSSRTTRKELLKWP